MFYASLGAIPYALKSNIAIEVVLDINFQYFNRQTSWINMRR